MPVLFAAQLYLRIRIINMCIGNTYVCRECSSDSYQIREGSHCDESQPFPAWHRVHGYTRRIPRCNSCVLEQSQRGTQEAVENARQQERAKALLEYFRGERTNPCIDVELALRNLTHQHDRTFGNEAAYRAGTRIHPFSSDSHSGENMIGSTSNYFDLRAISNPGDEIAASQPVAFAQCLARQEEIDAAGREPTEEDRQFDFESWVVNGGAARAARNAAQRFIEAIPEFSEANRDVLSRSQDISDGSSSDQPGGSPEVEAVQEIEEPPMSFYQWTMRQYEARDSIVPTGTTEEALNADLDEYENHYLSVYASEAQLTAFRARRETVRLGAFDFVPERMPFNAFSRFRTIALQRARVEGDIETLVMRAYEAFILQLGNIEIAFNFFSARTKFLEDNRLKLYNIPLDPTPETLTKLRSARARIWSLIAVAEERSWGDGVPNPVRALLEHLLDFFRDRIARLEDATEEQWAEINPKFRRGFELLHENPNYVEQQEQSRREVAQAREAGDNEDDDHESQQLDLQMPSSNPRRGSWATNFDRLMVDLAPDPPDPIEVTIEDILDAAFDMEDDDDSKWCSFDCFEGDMLDADNLNPGGPARLRQNSGIIPLSISVQ